MQNSNFNNLSDDFNKVAIARELTGRIAAKSSSQRLREELKGERVQWSRESLEGELGRQLNPARAANCACL